MEVVRSSTFRVSLTLAVAVFAASCGGPTSRPSEVDPSGPPEVRPDVVARHAEQFDGELEDREAGSQEEQGASQYVLGHLQRAGYFVRLDAVPVANLVESTNLVALPPSGEDPHTYVVVAYDTFGSETPSGEAIGIFLETARALYSADRDHRVAFAALGAEASDDHLGSRRLAQQLRDEGGDVRVVSIVPGEGEVGAAGALVDDFEQAASSESVTLGGAPEQSIYELDVFARAGFDSLVVTGPPVDLGAVLLAFLRDSGE